jgi:tape measure domain-containing protein
MLTAVGDAVAGLGGGQEMIDGVTRALGQMKAKGKVSAEEMNQLAERGIPGWQMLADKMGLTTAEAMKLSEKGLIPADQAIQALTGGMEKKFGGMMDKQSKTMMGLFSTLKDVASNTLTQISGPIFDVLKGKLDILMSKINEWRANGSLQEWANSAAGAIGTFWNIGSVVFDGLIGAGKFIIDNWGLIGPVLAGGLAGFLAFQAATTVMTLLKFALIQVNGVMAVNPIFLLVMAITALVAAGVMLYMHWDVVKVKAQELWVWLSQVWEGIKAKTIEAWNSIGTFFTNLWAGIKATTESVWNGIKTFFETVWNLIIAGVMAIVTPFANGIVTIWNSMKDGITLIMEGFKNYFIGVWEVIKNIFLGAVLLIIDLVTGDFTKLSTDAQGIWNNLKDAFAQIWQGINQVFSGAIQAISGFLKTEWDAIKGVAVTAWTSFKTWITDFWGQTVQGAKDIWNGLLTWFGELPQRLYDTAVNMFTSMKSGVTNIVPEIKSAIVTGIGEAIDWITALPDKAYGWGQDFIQGIVNGINAAAQWVSDAVEKVATNIRSFLHFSVPDQGPLVDYESWMPDFMKGLAKGIKDSEYLMKNAIQGLSANMAIGVSGQTLSLGTYGQFSSRNNQSESSTGGSSTTNIHINVKEMNVRDDNDIKKISQELWSLVESSQRSSGRRG